MFRPTSTVSLLLAVALALVPGCSMTPPSTPTPARRALVAISVPVPAPVPAARQLVAVPPEIVNSAPADPYDTAVVAPPAVRCRVGGEGEGAWRGGRPTQYARQWTGTALDLWGGRWGDLRTPLARMAPHVFPGVPLATHLGFIVAATRGEDNGQPRAPGASPLNVFYHEVGWWGLEAGPTFVGPTADACRRWHARRGRRAGEAPACTIGPSPNPDPAAPNNVWANLGRGRDAVALLGRGVSLAPGGWLAVDDQVAVGLLRQRVHGRATSAALPPALRARDERSQWFAMLASVGWSAGDGRAARHIARYAAAIEGVPESRRWGALLAAAAADVMAACRRPGAPAVYTNPAFAFIRATQKWFVARAVAARVGEDPAWFDLGLGDREAEVLDVLARAAYGGSFARPRPELAAR